MSAVLDLRKLRRTRRFPWDESTPDGTPASEVLMPRQAVALRAGEGDPLVAPPVDLRPQPSLLDAPPRQFFTEGTPPPVLEAPTTLRRTLALTPPVEEMSAGALPEIPAEALAARRRFTRPTFQSTGDEAADLANYERSLSEWRNPGDQNGRLKSFGLGALRGALRGLAAGGIGGAIGGALAGGIHGGVQPNADERASRDEEIERTQQRLGTLQQRRMGALKLRGMEADVTKTEAERDALLNPKPKPVNKQHVTIEGRAYTFDPEAGTYTDANLPGGKKLVRDHDELGPYFYDPDDPTKPIVRPTGAELRQFVDYQPLPGGASYRVPATTAAQGDAGVAAANVTAGTRHSGQVTDAQNTNAQNAYRAQLAERDEAQRVAQSFNELHGQLDAAVQRVQVLRGIVVGAQPSTPQDRATIAKAQAELSALEAQIPVLQTQVREQGQSVVSRYGRHVTYGPDERFRVNPAPPPPAVNAPPPPQLRPRPRVTAPSHRTGADPLGLFR